MPNLDPNLALIRRAYVWGAIAGAAFGFWASWCLTARLGPYPMKLSERFVCIVYSTTGGMSVGAIAAGIARFIIVQQRPR